MGNWLDLVRLLKNMMRAIRDSQIRGPSIPLMYPESPSKLHETHPSLYEHAYRNTSGPGRVPVHLDLNALAMIQAQMPCRKTKTGYEFFHNERSNKAAPIQAICDGVQWTFFPDQIGHKRSRSFCDGAPTTPPPQLALADMPRFAAALKQQH